MPGRGLVDFPKNIETHASGPRHTGLTIEERYTPNQNGNQDWHKRIWTNWKTFPQDDAQTL